MGRAWAGTGVGVGRGRGVVGGGGRRQGMGVQEVGDKTQMYFHVTLLPFFNVLVGVWFTFL